LGEEESVMAKKAAPQAKPAWESMRTAETRRIEDLLLTEFQRAEAYQSNSAAIRVRVVDPRFEGLSIADRQDMVIPVIRRLPKETQEDILLLLTMAPSELGGRNRHLLVNLEFEHPLPSRL
jgi:stress-induced morphogen